MLVFNIWPFRKITLPLCSESRSLPCEGGFGEMPEWSNGAVSKTVVPYGHPGFESLSLRGLRVTLRSVPGCLLPSRFYSSQERCFTIIARRSGTLSAVQRSPGCWFDLIS